MGTRGIILAWMAVSVLAVAQGQDLVPELAPAAKVHAANSSFLSDQRAAALRAARQVYLSVLDTADQAITAIGNVGASTAIAKEREAVARGGQTAAFPPDLPKDLLEPRKAYLQSVERIVTDFGQRQKDEDAIYLRVMAGLQPKAAYDRTLAAQILAEKQQLALGIHGPVTDLRKGLAGTRWRKLDDNSEWNFANGTLNKRWKYETPAPDKVKITWFGRGKTATLTLAKDGKTLLENGKPACALILE